MASSNYLVESTTDAFPAVQEAINRLLLGGLDVRLTPVSRNKALIPAHILAAIKAQYNIDPWKYLQSNGVTFTSRYAIEDEEALALVNHRSRDELDIAPKVAIPLVNGVQWHLEKINVVNAWNLLGGPDNIVWTCRVGQIDTGFTRHPALGFTNGSLTSPWFSVQESRNFFEPGADSGQDRGGDNGEDPGSGTFWGHGTRIGATISGWAPTGDGGKAFYGCAPKVPHVIVRISNSVAINDQLPAFAKALNYLVDVARVNVVNLSNGVFPPVLTPAAKKAINNAYDKGVIFVCAGGQYVKPVVSPASFRRSIAVSATTNLDQVWAKASRGPQIDWAAPGADIRRATPNGPNGPYVYSGNGDGTSYATALSTGVAALWLTHRAVEIKAAYNQPWMRVAAFREIARATAKPPAVWGPGVAGTGVLDAFAVLNQPLPPASQLVPEAPL